MLVNGGKVNVKNVKTLISSKEDNVKNVKRSLNVGPHAQAKYLVEKFENIGCNDAGGCFNYFVKCFKTLSENTIWGIYESSVNNPAVKSPIKYFIGACRNQMK